MYHSFKSSLLHCDCRGCWVNDDTFCRHSGVTTCLVRIRVSRKVPKTDATSGFVSCIEMSVCKVYSIYIVYIISFMISLYLWRPSGNKYEEGFVTSTDPGHIWTLLPLRVAHEVCYRKNADSNTEHFEKCWRSMVPYLQRTSSIIPVVLTQQTSFNADFVCLSQPDVASHFSL